MLYPKIQQFWSSPVPNYLTPHHFIHKDCNLVHVYLGVSSQLNPMNPVDLTSDKNI